MPFPEIRHCLICEDVRLERRRLGSLLGFYGTTPDVEILVQDFSLLVERLAFLFMGQRGDGQYRVSVHILYGPEEAIVRSPERRVTIPDAARRYNLAVRLDNVRFPHPGLCTLVLLVDGQAHYQTTFEVRKGEPADFD